MIKKIPILFTIFIFFGCNNENTSIKVDKKENIVKSEISLPADLMNLPRELKVWNEPEIVRASINPKDSVKYKWNMQTFIKSESDHEIKIIEFGDYELLSDGSWKLHNHTGKAFGSDNFTGWYFLVKNKEFTWENSKNAMVQPNETFVDMSNWTNRSDSLTYQKGIWYFIGQKDDGTQVVGYAFYENLPELLEP